MLLKSMERIFFNEDEWTGKVEIRAKKKFLAVGDLLQVLQGEHLSAMGSQQRGC